jgi:hypothetical protein
MRGHGSVRAAVTAVLLLWLPLLMTHAAAQEALQQQLAAVATSLDADVQRVLHDVEGLPRQLLAARAYLRAGAGLRNQWSWSEAQVAEFERSATRQQMLADIKRLTALFESLNPGFTLYVNTEVRSLGVQLERWNKNRTVGLLADELHAAASRAISVGQPLRQFLIDWRPSAAAPLAAPGLGSHGRGQALDFQIRKGERIVAGTEMASVSDDWDAAGWTLKLQRAVERSALPFRGPLLTPREPWHYEYAPERAAGK